MQTEEIFTDCYRMVIKLHFFVVAISVLINNAKKKKNYRLNVLWLMMGRNSHEKSSEKCLTQSVTTSDR